MTRWTLLAAGLALGLSLLVHRRLRRREALERLLGAALPWIVALLALFVAGMVARIPGRDWSAARLAPTACLVRGIPVYAPESEGAVLSTLYGPVSVLLYLPAVLSADVTVSLLLAGTINVLALLVPLAVLTLRPRAGEGLVVRAAVFLGALAALLSLPPTQQMVGGVHVDTATVGLGLLSCGLLATARDLPGRARLHASAALVVLAAWTKQVEFPLAFAELAYLWIRFGKGVAIAQALRLAGWALAIGVLFLAAFGTEGLLFNLVTIPASQPLAHLGYVPAELLRYALPPLFVLLLAALARATHAGSRRRWIEAPEIPYLLAALALLPTSVLARAKIGGFLNSYHSIPYLLVAAALAVEAHGLAKRGGASRRALLPAALLAALLCLPFAELAKGAAALENVAANPQRRAYDIARAHPGQAYFPWNPLATLMAEGRLDHFEYAVDDRELAGHPMSDEHVRSGLPPQLTWILYPPGRPRSMLRRLPEFARVVEPPGMEGWVVFTR